MLKSSSLANLKSAISYTNKLNLSGIPLDETEQPVNSGLTDYLTLLLDMI